MARRLRRLATPSHLHTARNPVALSAEVLASARAHFADHCASCHGNDGRGQTSIGRNLYPKAPDMTLPDTQDLVDGELFGIIENGIRLTGMPAWSAGGSHADESWALVAFIRTLPTLTPEELKQMEAMNPKSAHEAMEEADEDAFLRGDSPTPEKTP